MVEACQGQFGGEEPVGLELRMHEIAVAKHAAVVLDDLLKRRDGPLVADVIEAADDLRIFDILEQNGDRVAQFQLGQGKGATLEVVTERLFFGQRTVFPIRSNSPISSPTAPLSPRRARSRHVW